VTASDVETAMDSEANAKIATSVAEGRPGEDWAAFVASHPAATLYHGPEWLEVARESFGCQTFLIEARSASGRLAGVLPLVRQRTMLFGDRLTSLPYCNYGGPLVTADNVAEALMARAERLATDLGVSRMELRDREPRAAGWQTRRDKVTFELALPPTSEALGKALGSKLRSQIRRADREPLKIRAGAGELAADFYRVFAENMRDVGTPVYPARFFETVCRRLGASVRIVILDLDGEPAAAGLLLFYREGVEIPWAACTRQAKARSVNMRLYWELLRESISAGAKSFDFGRCTVDSTTYRFKKQWGAVPRPLYWHEWTRSRSSTPEAPPDAGAEGRATRIAASVWRRLPLSIANRLGPVISPGLPW
jgi:FemAB-related protein (PEP-CTERM system-associated)